jgi:hypothetical protein
MPNLNTYFTLMGVQARKEGYDLVEARRLLIQLLFPIDGEFIVEVARSFWQGYNEYRGENVYEGQ